MSAAPSPVAPALFPEVFAAQVAEHPDRVAVEFGDRALTYRELAGSATELADRLRDLGVGRNAVVGLAVSRSPELIVGMLGIMAAGGAWLPLDPSYPTQRLRHMLDDSGVRWVVTDPTATTTLPRHRARLVAVTGQPRPPDRHPHRPGVTPDDLAYVIYTSGSTGSPKGVLLTHRGLANLAAAQHRVFGGEAERRVLQFAPASFDASVFELVMALAVGGTLVLAPQDALLPGVGLADLLRDAQISHVTLPPSVLAALPYRSLPDLRALVCAGEALPEALVDRWAPGRRMYNAYGPTETTVWATVAEVTPGAGKPTIGAAIPGTYLRVLDGQLRPVAPGQPGELAIGGAGVARGYLNRPDLTRERFVADPYSDVEGTRLYRTGDIVRELPDGGLEFLGRVDHQIKLRGFRVEPDEVAAALRRHPEVRDAVVVPVGQGPDAHLVGYVVAGEVTGRELVRFAAERLPAHMVPAVVVTLDALPLTSSGKVDRKALPAPDRASTGLGGVGREPVTATERTLVRILTGLLGTEVGTADDFFALGGTSLTLGRLATRVSAELGVELPLGDIVGAPTVAAIAELIDTGRCPPAPPPLTRIESRGPVPLAFPQQQVWLLEQLSPGNRAYHAQATLRLTGPLDHGILQATLTEIVRRHEVFRTSFVARDGVPVQLSQPPMTVPLPVVDLSGVADDEHEAATETVVRAFLDAPFELDRPPLARWLLIRHGPGSHTLVHVEHHFVHDGWSFAVLLRELQQIYQAYATGRPSPLPDPQVRYADFAAWQRDWMRGEVLRRYLDHWTRRLAGCPHVLELPTDRPRPAVQSFQGDALRLELRPELARELRGYARQHQVSLFSVMLAGFAALLYRYAGQPDLLIGTGAANRFRPGLEDLIGMVVNTLVLRVDLSDGPDLARLAEQVHRTVAEANQWADIPLERLVEALTPVRDPGRNPLFQVMFSFHDSPVPDLDFGGVTGTVLERHNGTAKTDLNVVVIPRAEQRIGRRARDDDETITLIWEYRDDLFEPATMRRMVDHYQNLLAAALADPRCPVERLPLLEPSEHELLVDSWSSTGPADLSRHPVHHAVADWAARQPDAPALSWDGGRLSYRQLWHRAVGLAERLRRYDVAGSAPVAVLMDRSAELVLAELAVLAAGGCYLPLDPTYPPERIGFVLRDAGVRVVLTTERLRDRLPEHPGLAVLDVTTGAEEGSRDPGLPEVSQHDPGYVIYTSGSTGRPKGVAVAHGSLANLVAWHLAAYQLGPKDRTTLLASPGFDASVWEIWPTLAAGATLCVPPDGVRAAPADLVRWLCDERVTVAFLPTPLAAEVLAEPWPADTALRALLTGGDVLHQSPPEGLPFGLFNHYGPTENTVVATACEVPPGQARPPIGRPIPGVSGYVLDRWRQPVPVGVPGELHLGGAGLARGYLGRPELTSERFVTDPVAGRGRLYRTGDLVRWLPDGQLEFLGRVDDQVKIRGFRIEPAEVEATMRDHPAVRDAVVLARSDPGPGSGRTARLVGYAASERATDPGFPHELRDFLRTRLPGYMVPADVVALPAFPLTAHGKVDRDALPDPVPQHWQGRPPGTDAEHRIAEILTGLLPGRTVAADEDFFAAGGHSLLAARLVNEVNRAFGTDVPLARFLREATIAALARAVEEMGEDRTAGPGSDGLTGGPLSRRDAERLLTELDRLSDAEVESLLHQLHETEVDP